ncbi:HDOD domain-containing protein, partial [Kaarinaea lacus]
MMVSLMVVVIGCPSVCLKTLIKSRIETVVGNDKESQQTADLYAVDASFFLALILTKTGSYMHAELELEQAKTLVQGIDIPVRPAILQKIMEIQSQDEPDMDAVAGLIGSEVSLSAGVLKAVNSPLFGLRHEMSSIQQAVTLLGMNNVINLVIGISLRLEIGGNFNVAVERFWDTASDVALISAGLAKQLGNVPPDEAYTLGLFHDCGIPLLMLKDDNYVQLLKVANT